MRRVVDIFGREGGHRQLINIRRLVAVIVLLICTISLFSTFNPSLVGTKIDIYEVLRTVASDGFASDGWRPISPPLAEVWEGTVASNGWRPSSAPRADWPPPPKASNGYLRVRFNGSMMENRVAICDAVLVARIMNATLVLPELVSFPFADNSDFQSIYDVEHFIKLLTYDVPIVETLPEIYTQGKMKAYEILPPLHAPLIWYEQVALKKMKEHGAIYIDSSSYLLQSEINNHEFQLLRCRVNYHALRFNPQLLKLSNKIVSKLRSQGQFLAIDLRFERDLVLKCYDIFTPEEQDELRRYLYSPLISGLPNPKENRALGQCPPTPEEVGLILRAMGFNNSTRIYLVAGEFFGGERYLKPLRELFPHLENHSTMVPANELEEKNTFRISVVDYMVCLQADVFMPTYYQYGYEFYDEKSYFTNIVIGHRQYHGFRTTIQPDRKALVPIFIDREKKKKKNGTTAGFEEAVRRFVFNTSDFYFGMSPERRSFEESFYTNPWPDCFKFRPSMNFRATMNFRPTIGICGNKIPSPC